MKMKIILMACLVLSWQMFHSVIAAPSKNFGDQSSRGAKTSVSSISELSPHSGKVDPFVLGSEDIVSISVWGNKELASEMPVRPDGTISFPLIGDVKAQGLTPAQLKEVISSRLRKIISDASVTVIVVEINSINISVAGEVVDPGTYKVNRPITLLHLFSMVKGFTEKSDLRKSYLLRDNKKVDIDMYALVNKDDFSQNVWLKPNDFIFIHDNFDSRINIMGEVKNPQVITYQEGMTVMDAVLLSGGLTNIAKSGGTKIYRKNRNGSHAGQDIKKINVELDDVIFEGDLSKNTPLQPGDIIHVPRSFF